MWATQLWYCWLCQILGFRSQTGSSSNPYTLASTSMWILLPDPQSLSNSRSHFTLHKVSHAPDSGWRCWICRCLCSPVVQLLGLLKESSWSPLTIWFQLCCTAVGHAPCRVNNCACSSQLATHHQRRCAWPALPSHESLACARKHPCTWFPARPFSPV